MVDGDNKTQLAAADWQEWTDVFLIFVYQSYFQEWTDVFPIYVYQSYFQQRRLDLVGERESRIGNNKRREWAKFKNSLSRQELESLAII